MIDALLTWFVVVALFTVWKRFIKRQKVFVIDDSESDLMLYKLNLNLPEFDVQYFQSVKGLAIKIGIEEPALVVVDYRLRDKVDGDAVYKFCKANGFRCIVATAYDGEILGVQSSDIIRKDPGKEFYRAIENYVRGETA